MFLDFSGGQMLFLEVIPRQASLARCKEMLVMKFCSEQKIGMDQYWVGNVGEVYEGIKTQRMRLEMEFDSYGEESINIALEYGQSWSPKPNIYSKLRS